MRWDDLMSRIADNILTECRAHPALDDDAFLTHLLQNCGDDEQAKKDTERVWKKMKAYPHCFEVAAARSQLHMLDMRGGIRSTESPVVSKARFSFDGWTVDAADMEDYEAEGELTESLLQGMYILLRDRFPTTAYVFAPHLVRTRQVSRTLPQPRRHCPSTPASLPKIAMFPYRTTKSRHWVLYVVLKPSSASSKERLLLYKSPTVPIAALESTTRYMEKVFETSVEELDTLEKV